MKHVAFYDATTGTLTGQTLLADEAGVARNTPAGCKAWEILDGRVPDHLSMAVGPSGWLVPYQPPSPGEEYEWNDATKRWVLGSAAQLAIDNDVAARARLADIDRTSIRALREAAIGDKAALVLLQELEAQAVPLRADVITVATDEEVQAI